jgi:hypothetical protein
MHNRRQAELRDQIRRFNIEIEPNKKWLDQYKRWLTIEQLRVYSVANYYHFGGDDKGLTK